jgi:RimJ/RimL family protein N-acetyltransferase
MANVKLRALTLNDIEKTLTWHNQEDISDLYMGHPFPVNIEMERKWYEKILTTNFPITVFGIAHIETQNLIGITLLKDINMINRAAEFSIFIGDKKFRGKGFSIEATLETLSFGFNKIGLNRISLKVREDNKIAIKLYENVGFQREGLLRQRSSCSCRCRSCSSHRHARSPRRRCRRSRRRSRCTAP